jgi:trigger factor
MGGAGALRAEALRESLPDFYARAVVDTELDPIARPRSTSPAGEDSGAVSFDAVVQVRPLVAIPGYDGLQVTLPGLKVSDEEVEPARPAARERRRARVVDRAAIDGDFVTIDLHGNDATGPRWSASTTTSTRWAAALGGARARRRSCAAPRPAPSWPSTRQPRATRSRSSPSGCWSRRSRSRSCPRPPTSGPPRAPSSRPWPSCGRHRDRIGRGQAHAESDGAAPEDGRSPVAELVTDDEVPEVLVDAEVNERLHDLQHRLEAQKLGLAEYFQATGTTRRAPGRVRVDALAAVKADLALRALVEAEELTLSDEELLAEIVTMAERMGTTPAELRRQLDTAGRTGAVRSELRKAKALQWLLDHVELFDEEGNPMSRDDLKVDASAKSSRTRRASEDAESGGSVQGDNYLVPTVIESSNRGERAYDLYSRLLRERIIFSARRSTTRWPTSSAPRCSSWSPRSRTRTSTSTSTRPAATSRRCSPSTTR